MSTVSKLKQVFWGHLPKRARRFLVGLFLLDILMLFSYLAILIRRGDFALMDYFLSNGFVEPYQIEQLYLHFSYAGFDPFLLSLMLATHIPLLVLLFLIAFRLVVSVNFLPFLPTQKLDERQRLNRDRIFQISFWFLCLMGLLYSGFQMGLSAQAKQEGTVSAYSIYADGTKEYIVNSSDGSPWVQLGTLTHYLDFSMAVFRILLIACLVLPILITAWTEPDPIEQENYWGKLHNYVSR